MALRAYWTMVVLASGQRNVLARPDGGAPGIEDLGTLVQLAHDVHARDVGRRDREVELAEQHVRARVERERAGNRGGGVHHRRLLLDRPQRDGASRWPCRTRGTRGTRIGLEPTRAGGPAVPVSPVGPVAPVGPVGPRGTLVPGVALRTLNPCRALATSWTRRPDRPLHTGRAGCSLCARRARISL